MANLGIPLFVSKKTNTQNQLALYLTTKSEYQQILCWGLGYVPGSRSQIIHIFFFKNRLLKCLPQCKCMTSSSQIHLALLIKLLLKTMEQLPVTSTEQSKVSTKWQGRTSTISSFKYEGKDAHPVCHQNISVSLTTSYGSTQTYLKIEQLQLTILIFCLEASSCSASKQLGRTGLPLGPYSSPKRVPLHVNIQTKVTAAWEEHPYNPYFSPNKAVCYIP